MKLVQRSLLAAAVAAGVAFTGLAQAAVPAVVSEGLLYPFVYYDTVRGINTWISVHTTDVIGQDTVPNDYTAPHVWAAQRQNGYLPVPGQGAPEGILFLNWFNYRSQKVLDLEIPVTPNDKEYLSLQALGLTAGPNMNRVPGYIVIVSENGAAGLAGDILMMGDALLETGSGEWASLPALPLADGPDGAGATAQRIPSNNNNCVTDFPGNPATVTCSPLVACTRTDNSDTDRRDLAIVDVELGPLNTVLQTLIIWRDQNYGGNIGYFRYDEDELRCSGSIPAPNEVNVLVLGPARQAPWTTTGWWGTPGPAGASLPKLCELSGQDFDADSGILRLRIPEGLTNNAIPGPNSASCVFTLMADNQTLTPDGLASFLGHDVGKINQ